MSNITNKFRADVGIRLLHVIEGPIDYVIHYVKTTNGPPTNPALLNEHCLNTFSHILYYFNNTSWIPITIQSNFRFVFCGSGSVSSGNGTNIPNMYIYTWDGEEFIISAATDGVSVLIRNTSLNYNQNSILIYDNINNTWITSTASDNTSSYTLPTEISIGSNRAVASVDGYAVYADNSLNLSAIGISSGAVVGGNDVSVQSIGKMLTTSAGWTINDVIYLSTNGTMTQTEPTSGISQTLGKAHKSDSIIINIDKPIILV